MISILHHNAWTRSKGEDPMYKYCPQNNTIHSTTHLIPSHIHNRYPHRSSTMKFSALAVFLISPLILASPAPDMEKRAAVSATVKVDGLRYRNCPKTSCSAPGQFAKGTKISLSCYTRDNTETINGDK